jgi:hypothetical protein
MTPMTHFPYFLDHFDPDELFTGPGHNGRENPNGVAEKDSDSWSSSDEDGRPPINYAYDAVAERHQERLRAGKLAQLADLAITPPPPTTTTATTSPTAPRLVGGEKVNGV